MIARTDQNIAVPLVDLLVELEHLGVSFWAQDMKLQLERADGPPPDETLRRIRARKPALLTLLSTDPKTLGPELLLDYEERLAVMVEDGGLPDDPRTRQMALADTLDWADPARRGGTIGTLAEAAAEVGLGMVIMEQGEADDGDDLQA